MSGESFSTLCLSTNVWMAVITGMPQGSIHGSKFKQAFASEVCTDRHQALSLSVVDKSYGLLQPQVTARMLPQEGSSRSVMPTFILLQQVETRGLGQCTPWGNASITFTALGNVRSCGGDDQAHSGPGLVAHR